jgi:predicted metalloprotease with PDZ domain
VPRGTPAFDAGLNAGDEIIAIDNLRVTPAQYVRRLEALPAGRDVRVLIARRETLETLTLRVVDPPAPMWDLRVAASASSTQRAHLASWLSS